MLLQIHKDLTDKNYEYRYNIDIAKELVSIDTERKVPIHCKF